MSSSCDAPRRTSVLRGAPAVASPLPFHLELMPEPVVTTPDTTRTLAEALDDGFRCGYDDGYREGVRKAHAEAAAELERLDAERRARLAPSLASLDEAARQLAAREVATAAQIEQSIIHGALELAGALVGRYLDATESAARDAIARALALVPPRVAVSVRLHPDDLASLDTAAQDRDGDVRFVADPGVERGGAIVDGPHWSIDAQLGPALDRAREALGA